MFLVAIVRLLSQSLSLALSPDLNHSLRSAFSLDSFISIFAPPQLCFSPVLIKRACRSCSPLGEESVCAARGRGVGGGTGWTELSRQQRDRETETEREREALQPEGHHGQHLSPSVLRHPGQAKKQLQNRLIKPRHSTEGFQKVLRTGRYQPLRCLL